MKFGAHENIRTSGFDKAFSDKMTYRFGDPKIRYEKVANSYAVENDQEALSHMIKTLKTVNSGDSEYACIELFTDKEKVIRINICHIKDTL